jgi:hypothetical protein
MYIIYIYIFYKHTYIYTTNVYYIYMHRKNTYHYLYWAILCIGTTIEVVSYTEHAAGFNGTPINGFPPKKWSKNCAVHQMWIFASQNDFLIPTTLNHDSPQVPYSSAGFVCRFATSEDTWCTMPMQAGCCVCCCVNHRECKLYNFYVS